jgi:hypothetical protein
MKTNLLLLLLPLFLGSCVKYQYMVVDSKLTKTRKGEMVVDTDSLKIIYRFSGSRGIASARLYNKLDVPIYVSWQQSALIVNNRSESYANGEAQFEAYVSGTQFHWNELTTSSISSVTGTITQTPPLGFIPPRSFIESTPILFHNNFMALSKHELQTITTATGRIRFQNFDKEKSPLIFRSYFTLSTNSNLENPIVFDHEFWIDEVSTTMIEPSNLHDYKNREDVFYIGKATSVGAILLSLGVLSFFALMIPAGLHQ